MDEKKQPTPEPKDNPNFWVRQIKKLGQTDKKLEVKITKK